MRTLLFSLVMAFISVAIAESTTYEVDGMHCSGCKKMISKSVCKNDELAKTFEKCEVRLIDEKKQIGQIIITPKADQKLDLEKVSAAVKDAGDGYKVRVKSSAKESK